ncbi:hypothetical protein RBSH_02743 [Rhodopirellula baltica SH28]|uniref:Uncharacterized protein n=1 Tax=Rhodopirellula baltica SH28 TaxID=993517 RepID=K5D5D4_RHOBT|nr:hypothetical protein RBSH_02743 [Rhodopirellula baltica SH28]
MQRHGKKQKQKEIVEEVGVSPSMFLMNWQGTTSPASTIIHCMPNAEPISQRN